MLGRFLTSRTHFSNSDVKPAAFSPPPDLKLSVVRIDSLTLREIWNIGQTQVIDKLPPGRTLYGMGKLKVSDVQSQNLTVDPDNNPFYRHSSIIGWPEKAKWISITQQLAAVSELVLK